MGGVAKTAVQLAKGRPEARRKPRPLQRRCHESGADGIIGQVPKNAIKVLRSANGVIMKSILPDAAFGLESAIEMVGR